MYGFAISANGVTSLDSGGQRGGSYLTGVGLSARPPPIAPARPPLQPELEYAA